MPSLLLACLAYLSVALYAFLSRQSRPARQVPALHPRLGDPACGTSTTVIPAVTPGSSVPGPSIAASARPAFSSPITSPTSRPGRSVPSVTSRSIAG